VSRDAERLAGRGAFYPADPVEQRYHRDAHFHSLVKTLECYLQRYEFSPSELREAVMLAATRNEMRICRPAFVLSDGEIVEFLARTGRDPKGDEELTRLKYVETVLEHPELAAELIAVHEKKSDQ
jgi:hypothetical protein